MWQNRLISKKNHHWRDVAIKVWVSMPFLGLSGGFAEWKKGMHFGASVGFYALFGLVGEVCGAEKGHAFWSKSVDFHALFGLVGGFAARKKGMHFGARVWISMPFLGFLGEAAAWKKGKQFEVSGRG